MSEAEPTHTDALAALFSAREKLRLIQGWIASQGGTPTKEDLQLANEAIEEGAAAMEWLLQSGDNPQTKPGGMRPGG